MKSTNMKERKKMRAKQVTALMMAATLAVTSNGVTALAAPAADAATESAESSISAQSAFHRSG